MNNILKATIVVVMCCFASHLSAQEDPSKNMEREIKVSGNYYYGDGSGGSVSDAKSAAIEELKIMITESVRMDNPDVGSVNFVGFDSSIGTVTMDLDGYIRVIAFILKKELSLENNGQKSVVVTNVSSGGAVAANSTTQAEVSEPTPIATPTPTPTPTVEPVAETPKVEEVTEKIEEPKAIVEEPKTVIEEPKVAVVEEPKAVVEEPKPVAVQEDNIEPAKTHNAIINEILGLTESKDVGELLNKYKNVGKLGYGRVSTITNPEKCYFVVLRSGKLVDVLDQGSSTSREGLISGGYVNYKTSYDTIYWVYLY